MNLLELREVLARLDIRLLPLGDGSLELDAPDHVDLTDDLLDAVRERKSELLELLAEQARSATPTGPPAAPDPRADPSEFGRWLRALTQYNEATRQLKPVRPWPWFEERRDYAAETRRGDELRARGEAVPLCWLPD
jgi:hypothetical protein